MGKILAQRLGALESCPDSHDLRLVRRLGSPGAVTRFIRVATVLRTVIGRIIAGGRHGGTAAGGRHGGTAAGGRHGGTAAAADADVDAVRARGRPEHRFSACPGIVPTSRAPRLGFLQSVRPLRGVDPGQGRRTSDGRRKAKKMNADQHGYTHRLEADRPISACSSVSPQGVLRVTLETLPTHHERRMRLR